MTLVRSAAVLWWAEMHLEQLDPLALDAQRLDQRWTAAVELFGGGRSISRAEAYFARSCYRGDPTRRCAKAQKPQFYLFAVLGCCGISEAALREEPSFARIDVGMLGGEYNVECEKCSNRVSAILRAALTCIEPASYTLDL